MSLNDTLEADITEFFQCKLDVLYTLRKRCLVLVHKAATRWHTCSARTDCSFRPTVRTVPHSFWSSGIIFVFFETVLYVFTSVCVMNV